MTRVNIKARIKRNMLDQFAGTHYRDENSGIVKFLNGQNKKALVGIQREDGIYTIIGENSVYYLTTFNVEGEILLKDFIELLTKNAMSQGKKGHFEFINVNEQDAVWLKDISTMNALWNTMLLLYNSQEGK